MTGRTIEELEHAIANDQQRVLVCGGRDFANEDAVWEALTLIDETDGVSCVIHGGCRGADAFAGRWAEAHATSVHVVRPNWQAYGKRAGPMRNQSMLDLKPSVVLAFPGGNGTADMVRRAHTAGVRVITAPEHVDAFRAILGLSDSTLSEIRGAQ